jgi:hypothetical protein
MWTKFKSFPLSVKIAIIFLTITIIGLLVTIPVVFVPIVLIVGFAISVFRVIMFFVHGE